MAIEENSAHHRKTFYRRIRVRFCMKGLTRYDLVCVRARECACQISNWNYYFQWMVESIEFTVLLKYLNLHFDTYLYRSFFLLFCSWKYIHSFIIFISNCLSLHSFAKICFCFCLCISFFVDFWSQFEKQKTKKLKLRADSFVLFCVGKKYLNFVLVLLVDLFIYFGL